MFTVSVISQHFETRDVYTLTLTLALTLKLTLTLALTLTLTQNLLLQLETSAVFLAAFTEYVSLTMTSPPPCVCVLVEGS